MGEHHLLEPKIGLAHENREMKAITDMIDGHINHLANPDHRALAQEQLESIRIRLQSMLDQKKMTQAEYDHLANMIDTALPPQK